MVCSPYRKPWALDLQAARPWTSPSDTSLLWKILGTQNRDVASSGTGSPLLASTTAMRSASTIITSCLSVESMPSCIRFGHCSFYSRIYSGYVKKQTWLTLNGMLLCWQCGKVVHSSTALSSSRNTWLIKQLSCQPSLIKWWQESHS